jgi:hypothetical protein
MRKLLIFIGLCLSLNGVAQTYTFECVSGARLSGDSCDICPNTIVESRSFNGLVIYRDSTFYRWLDQPYSIRVKPGGIMEYWEHGANPYSERVTIPLSLTGFSTIQGMADSTWCNFTAPIRFAELNLDSISTTTAKAWLSGSNTGFGLREGSGVTFSYDVDTIVISASGGAGIDTVKITAPAAGFTVSGSPGVAPTASFVFTLANDLAALEALTGTGIPARTGVDTWALRTITAGTGISVANGDGVATNPTITNTAPDQTVSITGAGISVVTGTYPAFTVTSTEVDGSTTNEVQTYGHGGTTTYTNTLSLGGGSWSITGAGIAAISNTAGAITVTATEAQVANNGLSDNEAGGGIFRLGNRYMNGSDGLFSNDRKVNLNAFRLFIGDNTDSTLLHIDGTNDKVGVHTTSPGRTFSVNGEVEIKDLTTTNPANLVGVDANGVLSEVFLGTNLSFTGTTLNVTGGTGTVTSVSSGNFSPLFTVSVATATTTPAFSFTATNGTAKSVFGVTGNAAAARADIATTTADQVLVNNGGNTAIGWGTVATGGITNSAVTYAKMQNVSATARVLGRKTAGAGVVEELSITDMYTLLGMTGVANRFALWTGTNTLASDAAFTFDGANDRATFTGTVSGTGAGTGILNLSTGTLAGATTFLSMRGTINSNLIAEMINSSTNTAGNSILNMATVDAAGDPYIQYQLTGAGGITFSAGVDNTTNRFMISPNSATLGAVVGQNIVVKDNAGLTLFGIDNDNPVQPLTVEGRGRADLWMGEGNMYTSANVTFGTGAGTGPSVGSIRGTGNSVMINFTTGTTPTAGGNILTLTYPTSFPTLSMVTFSAGIDGGGVAGDNAANAIGGNLVKIETSGTTTFIFKSNGALTASTAYAFTFMFDGY